MPRTLGRILIYTALILWTIIALFPIYWTFTTTFKVTAVPTNTFTSTGCCVITGASTNLTDAGTEDTDPLPRAVTNTV